MNDMDHPNRVEDVRVVWGGKCDSKSLLAGLTVSFGLNVYVIQETKRTT